MRRKPSPQVDSFEHQIERALNPGAFIADRACFSFARDLEEVAAKIAQLTGSDPARAVALYETFLAGCYEKAEEIDDSSGSFGQFVGELCCGWITTRQRDGADPDETASRLIGWMEDDPYGFCYHLEKDAAKVLDKTGRTAFVKQIRARFDGTTKATPKTDGDFRDRLEYSRRRWSEVLRTLYTAQKNVEAYIALTDETGVDAQDCHAIATLLLTRRKPSEALAWVERGIDLDKKASRGSMAGYGLAKLKRELLTKLGRGKEALDAAWAEFCEHPSKYTYGDLMKFVPKDERTAWHSKAIEAANGADIESLLELLMETKELGRIAGYFRSPPLAAASQGFSAFAGAGGKMRLVVGADLEVEDVAAILQGDSQRMADRLNASLGETQAWPEDVKRGVELLSWMVSKGVMDVRVAFRVHKETGKPLPMSAFDDGYVHEKWAVFTDGDGRRVYISGSLNEPKNALVHNAENIDLHAKWWGDIERKRVEDAAGVFEALWDNHNPYVQVMSLPEAVKQRLIDIGKSVTALTEIDGTSARKPEVEPPSALERLRFALIKDAPKLTGGRFVGMETVPIEPWPHSFLLCDEVGLGKTIEAGLAIKGGQYVDPQTKALRGTERDEIEHRFLRGEIDVPCVRTLRRKG